MPYSICIIHRCLPCFRPLISLSWSGKHWKCHLPMPVIKPRDFCPGVRTHRLPDTDSLSLPPFKNYPKTSFFLLQISNADVHQAAVHCHGDSLSSCPSPPRWRKGGSEGRKKKLKINNFNNVMKSRLGYKNPLRAGVVLAMGSAPTPSLSVALSLSLSSTP